MIITIAERIRTRLSDVTRGEFLLSRDEFDLAFRLAAIGEYANKLSPELKARHPEVRWRAAYGLRNVIAHDYDGIAPLLTWETVGAALDALVAACRIELGDR